MTATTEPYEVGDLANLTATFTDDTGALVDPTVVTFYIKNPATDVVLMATPTRLSQGVYRYQQPCTDAGTWTWRAVGTGLVTAAQRGSFLVAPTTL